MIINYANNCLRIQRPKEVIEFIIFFFNDVSNDVGNYRACLAQLNYGLIVLSCNK